MAAVGIVVLVLTLAAAVAVWVRGRLAAARARQVDLEAFRVSLGLPADRFRIVDDNPVQAWRAHRGVRSFASVHRVPSPAPAAPVLVQP